VKTIVANTATQDMAAGNRFYQDVLGLDFLMHLGWITTYSSKDQMAIQISVASQGGSGTPTPDLSIEVDDLDAALERVRTAGFPIERPAVEPWGVRRFYTRDPLGKLVNILASAGPECRRLSRARTSVARQEPTPPAGRRRSARRWRRGRRCASRAPWPGARGAARRRPSGRCTPQLAGVHALAELAAGVLAQTYFRRLSHDSTLTPTSERIAAISLAT
jgi:catechol 2,3-dioxygenase-like lactoylglutathione lyase family enzyme